MSTLYWLTVFGNISGLAALAACFFIAVYIASLIGKIIDDNAKLYKKFCKANIIGMFISLALYILIPSKTELYAIYGVGSVIDYAKNSKEVQKLPDNAVKALNVYLENIQEKDSINNK